LVVAVEVAEAQELVLDLVVAAVLVVITTQQVATLMREHFQFQLVEPLLVCITTLLRLVTQQLLVDLRFFGRKVVAVVFLQDLLLMVLLEHRVAVA
jgi:hypothetical protein